MPKPYRLDMRRARRVFGRIVVAYQRQQFPFNLPGVVLPHIDERLPNTMHRGGEDHARFLFYACLQMKGGIKSDTALQTLARLHERRPDLFRPECAGRLSPADVTRLLVDYRLGLNSQLIGQHWVENSRRLMARHDGRVIGMFHGIRTYDEACRLVLNQLNGPSGPAGFLGFGHKMVSMLLYFLIDARLITEFPFPPPVDIHWLRLLVEHRILSWRGRIGTEPPDDLPYGGNFFQPGILADVRRLLRRYIETCGWPQVEVNNAIWLYAKTLCGRQPGNRSHHGRYPARRTTVRPVSIAWTPEQLRAYQQTCARCIVQRTCRFNVPSALYNQLGRIQIRGRRPQPPVSSQLSFSWKRKTS
ncbi:MAG: hypothetical protein HYY50_03630 [Candidatus Kerfeldbacteria bacterium]|nr:hypothetical protein [Candidatus Kerfeldbacteria bacterium]